MQQFMDSSIIIEIINQNKNYSRFKENTIITNSLNLSEVYFIILKNYDVQTADYWTSNLDFIFLEITPEIAVEAAKFNSNTKARI
ncbi:PIN domain-containing protein [Candidatus Pacearchaeota archaeon]|nr:PIN domain-containing protein [Candidatus Pacearchaeota archaeon]